MGRRLSTIPPGSSGAGIGDRDPDIGAGRRFGINDMLSVEHYISCLDENASSACHSVAGIDDEVEDGSLELPRVDLDQREIWAQDRHHLDLLAYDPADQVLNIRDKPVDVDRLRVADLPSGVGQ